MRKRELTPLSSSRWAGSITKKAPGGYRFQREWHAKSRRLRVLQDQPAAVRADREAGLVHVVRGGKRLARARHHWMRPR